MTVQKETVFGRSSWIFKNDEVEIAVTEQGGQMAPVTFFRRSEAKIRPYYVNPWHDQGIDTGLPLLDVLRGDFFCMPFGAENRYLEEDHPPHGESANSDWTFETLLSEGGVTELTLSLPVKSRPGEIVKRLSLVDGQNVIYCRHDLESFNGKMCLSHHAILQVPEDTHSISISTSSIRLGMVNPRANLTNSGNEYYALSPGARFESLERVPTVWKDQPYEDCSAFPNRYGFMDLVAVFANPDRTPAWVAAAVPSKRYVWYSLKNPNILPQTLCWFSNGGRHGAPWSGRNRCLALEDGCAYFGSGLAESAGTNILNQEGIRTSLQLDPQKPTAINYVQGVVRIPEGFDKVKEIQFEEGSITIRSHSGLSVRTDVAWSFLESGVLSRTDR